MLEHTPLFDVVIEFLQSKGIEGTFVADETSIRLDGDGEHGSWLMWISTFEELDRCIVYSVAKFKVPTERLTATYELLSRINVTLHIGNFEVDPDTGQLGFRAGIDVEGDDLTAALVSQLVSANVSAFDHYLPALRSVVANGTAPVDALAAVGDLH